VAISTSVDVKPAQLWPQGDMRDPLGVWGARLVIAGDATGGEIKIGIAVPQSLSGAYVYTMYAATISQLDGIGGTTDLMCRLLTNWPDVDPTAGVQAFSVNNAAGASGTDTFTPPLTAPSRALVNPNDRFLLLFDPRSIPSAFNIAELKVATMVDLANYSFEAYGYFWDRSVLNAPGGPRHPGSS